MSKKKNGSIIDFPNVTKTSEKEIESAAEIKAREALFQLTLGNVQKIGNKHFVSVPLSLLFVDEAFQRMDDSSPRVINRLIENWDDNKMDALRVSPHYETNNFSIIDGFHRYTAASEKGIQHLTVEVLQGLSSDVEERLVQEATIFATQNDESETLTIVQKHKANVLRGITEHVWLDELAEKYNIPLKRSKGRGRVKVGYLGGFYQAICILKSAGYDMLDTILYILCESRWNLARKGLAKETLAFMYTVLRLHPDHIDEIADVCIKYFSPIEPNKFYAEAAVAYPERSNASGLALHLEDIVCNTLGIDRVFLQDDLTIERDYNIA